MRRPGRPYVLLLVAAGLGGALLLWRQFPFAFYSPDGSFHAAKLVRAAEGDPFRDPFSGTLSLYPALFHLAFGAVKRGLGLSTLELVRLVQVVDLVGLLATFFCLARAALRDLDRAALATLALALTFYSPTGRHILVASPSNFALLPLFLGGACVVGFLESGGRRRLVAGLLLLSLAVNVVWYDLIPAAALLVLLVAQRRAGLGLGLAAAAFLLPFLWTGAQLHAIRSVLPDYAGFASVELGRQGGGGPLDALLEWGLVLATKANFRFDAALRRSPAALAHYYGLVLPGALLLAAATALLDRRLRALSDDDARGARRLLLGALLVFLLSLPLAITRDVPRLARVQFVGWALLLLFVLRGAWRVWGESWWRRAGPPLAGAGLLALAFSLRHTDRPFAPEPPRPTGAVVDFIAAIPDHAVARLFVTEASLRRLIPFVSFTSFVNHGDGRYYAQDPVSSARLLEAYRVLRDRRLDWRAVGEAWGVRYFVFRHAEAGAERELALAYLRDGRAVLANEEWWIIAPAEPGAAPAPQ